MFTDYFQCAERHNQGGTVPRHFQAISLMMKVREAVVQRKARVVETL